MKPQQGLYGPKCYRIKLEGRLDEGWTTYFDGLELTYCAGATVLTGQVADQAALHGLLNRIRDLNLTLISACRLDPQVYDPRGGL